MPAVEVDDAALLGVLAAFKSLPKEFQKQVQKQTKGTLTPMFRDVYQQRAAEGAGRRGHGSAKQDLKMAGKGTVTLSVAGRGTLKGYTSGKALSGGMTPGTDWPWVEFGTKGQWAKTGQLPWWRKGGRIFYPTVAAFAPTAQRAYMFAVYETLRSIPEVEND